MPLMQFDYGGTFRQAFDQAKEAKRVEGLRGLLGDYYGQQDPMLGQVARAGGDAGALQQDAQEQARRIAGMIAAAPAQMRPAIYAANKARLAQIGLQGLPDDWSEELLPVAQQMAGLGQANTGIQSTFVDARGVRMGVTRDGRTIELGQNAPNNQIIDTGNGFVGVNKGSLQAAPVMMGQSAQQAPQPPPQGTNDEVLRVANAMAQAGVPAPQIEAWMAKQPGMMPASMAEPVMPQGQQLRSVPKSEAPEKPPAGYRWNPDGSLAPIPGGPAQIALDARRAASEAKDSASQVRQAEAAGQASQLVAAIDRLTKSSGFPDLGTTWGDIELNTPLVRTDAKDAQAQLKNIAGQIALTTMSRLKALSATGATGFGSLTEKELQLLENSIATLQSDRISNKELKESLGIIRETMGKVARWKAPAGSQTPAGSQAYDVDSLLEKYK